MRACDQSLSTLNAKPQRSPSFRREAQREEFIQSECLSAILLIHSISPRSLSFAAKLHCFKDLCGSLPNLRALCGSGFICHYNRYRFQTVVFLKGSKSFLNRLFLAQINQCKWNNKKGDENKAKTRQAVLQAEFP